MIGRIFHYIKKPYGKWWNSPFARWHSRDFLGFGLVLVSLFVYNQVEKVLLNIVYCIQTESAPLRVKMTNIIIQNYFMYGRAMFNNIKLFVIGRLMFIVIVF